MIHAFPKYISECNLPQMKLNPCTLILTKDFYTIVHQIDVRRDTQGRGL